MNDPSRIGHVTTQASSKTCWSFSTPDPLPSVVKSLSKLSLPLLEDQDDLPCCCSASSQPREKDSKFGDHGISTLKRMMPIGVSGISRWCMWKCRSRPLNATGASYRSQRVHDLIFNVTEVCARISVILQRSHDEYLPARAMPSKL